MPSKGTIAAEQYTNTAEMAERPGWFQAGSSHPTVDVTNLVGELNGKWIDLSALSGNQGIQRRFVPDLVNASRELELTTAIYLQDVSSPSANSDLMRLGVGSSTSTPNLTLEPRLNPDTSLNDRLFISRRNSTLTDYFDTGVDVEQNAVLYVTLRLVAETAVGADDGSAECWINGTQVYTETGINWSTSATNAEFNTTCYAAIGSAPGIGPYFRSMMVNDTITTTFGTAPEYKHVVSAEVNNVVATGYTNEGGAADFVAAVTDDDDTTYMETTVASEQASFDFAIPASLASQPIRDIQLRLKASRGNGTFNDIDVAVRSGLVDVANSTESVTVVDPSRGLIEPIYVPASTTNLDDFIILVSNGS